MEGVKRRRRNGSRKSVDMGVGMLVGVKGGGEGGRGGGRRGGRGGGGGGEEGGGGGRGGREGGEREMEREKTGSYPLSAMTANLFCSLSWTMYEMAVAVSSRHRPLRE